MIRVHTYRLLFLLIVFFLAGSAAADDDNAKLAGHQIELPDASIYVSFAPGDIQLQQSALLHWVEQGAKQVSNYYGKFPISNLMLLVQPVSGQGVMSGTAYGGEVPYLVLKVGEQASLKSLSRDWILVHEMVHLAMPQLRRYHHWLEEGVATYIEPFVRFQAGIVQEEYIWKWLYEGLPNGLPPNNIGGLDHNMSWGNIYWGGTLFCFLADLEIREASKGTLGLKDALIAIVESGGSIEQDWTIRQVLKVADQSLGMPTLNRLYSRMSEDLTGFDLEEIWKDLGVSMVNGQIRLSDDAPKAWLRQSLTQK